MKKFIFITVTCMFVCAACSNNSTDKKKIPPECQITSPVDGAEVSADVPLDIRWIASDEDGYVEKIILHLNDAVISDIDRTDDSYTIPAEELTAGNLKITLEVTDNDGGSASHQVAVTVVETPQPQAPTCRITAPAAGAEYSQGQIITVTFTAEDEDGTIAKVMLSYADISIEVSDIEAGSQDIETEELEIGELKLQLTVEDDDGLTAEDQITINILPYNEAPACELLLPLAGVAYTAGDLRIMGNAVDSDGTITGVALKVGGQLIPDVTSVPFNYLFSGADHPEGGVKVELTVTDNGGKTATAESDITFVARYGTMTDSRDGKVYKTVRLGDKVWFAENLAYLPSVNTWSEGSNTPGNAGMKFYYVALYAGNDVAAAKATDHYKKGGVLYNWFAAMDGEPGGDPDAMPSGIRGACPEGWHMPGKAEVEEMLNWVGAQIPDNYEVSGSKNIGGALRGFEDWDVKTNAAYPQLELGSLNLFGFNAYPSGQRMATGGFDNQKQYMFLWNTQYIDVNGNAGYTTIRYDKYEVTNSYTSSNKGHSVRCVKDY